MLTGKTPFGEGTVAQKLIWHQTRLPKALAEFRTDVPAALQDILSKMMAKDPADRYAVPAQVAEALIPFTQTPIGPPPESEMPHLSLAATGAGPQDGQGNTTVSKASSSGQRLSVNSPKTSPEAAEAQLSAPLLSAPLRAQAKRSDSQAEPTGRRQSAKRSRPSNGCRATEPTGRPAAAGSG